MNGQKAAGLVQALVDIARSRIVEPGVAPAAAVAVGLTHGDGWRLGSGAAGSLSPTRPRNVDPKTPFDLASVTKPIVACAAARLIEDGLFEFETPLGELLEEARGTPSEGIPVELFLAHRAGLEAHLPLYAPLTRGEPVDKGAALHEAARARREECRGSVPDGRSGFPPRYSDVGYLLVGEAAARAASKPLDQVVLDQVARPLDVEIGSVRAWEARAPERMARVAPTEQVSWRGGLVTGEVHDENAWALAGRGTAGHAGLFGTAPAVATFGAAVVDALRSQREEWLRARTARRLVEPRPGGTLRAGFDGKSSTGSSAGERMGSEAFGHLGFTGTSLWCDPSAGVVVVLLSNRVCPTRLHVAIRDTRPAVHDALYEAALSLAG